MFFTRLLQQQIEKWLFKKKILIVYGPRQVGKTTLVKAILKKYPQESAYFNCEDLHVKENLEIPNSEHLRKYLGSYKLIVLDEAHLVVNIGQTLKLIWDELPDLQVIATGSSSFELSNKVNEPLTGRALEFKLFPLSIAEISEKYDKFQLKTVVKNILRFGSYPEVVNANLQDAPVLVSNITNKYLFKDILEFEGLKNPDVILKLLQALALQVGNEVSYTELGNMLNISKNTATKYIDLLEKCFVIYRLKPFSRNLRKEINKKQKIYFYDLGIRNSIINNFNDPDLRTDKGALWENFLIIERLKRNQYEGRLANSYFWRTHDQKEIDYVEDAGGKLAGFEFKWQSDKFKKPQEFLKTYANSSVDLINQKNFFEFVGIDATVVL